MIQVNHGGDNFRGQSLHEPLPTITQKHGFGVVTTIVAPYMDKAFGGNYQGAGSNMKDPVSTITTVDHNRLISPILIQYHSETSKNGVRGQQVDNPIQTIDTSNRYGLVTSYMTKFYKSGSGQGLDEPIHTITTSPGHFGTVSVYAEDWKELQKNGVSEEIAQKCTWVSKFIMEYYGCGIGQSLNDPLHTIVTKDRFALITVLGNEYVILDIFLRMLKPEELKMGQGFPSDYIIDRDYKWNRYPIAKQVARIGNSVVPIMAKKLVECNCPYLRVGERQPVLSMRMVKTEEDGQMKFA